MKLTEMRWIIGLIIGSLFISAASATLAEDDSPQGRLSLRQSPSLHFEPNRGQFASPVVFAGRGLAYSLALDCGGARLGMDGQNMAIRLMGHNRICAAAGLEPLPGRSHYLRGADRKAWLTDVPHYSRARLGEVYSGIDVEFYDRGGELEFDFIIAPGADPAQIELEYVGVQTVALGPNADLRLQLADRDLLQRAPVAYQDLPQGRRPVEVAYHLRGDRHVGFSIGDYDPMRPLIIDPVLSYSSYLGGVGTDAIYAAAVDADGNLYVTGETDSAEPDTQPFPVTVGALKTALPREDGVDAFVTKISADGSSILYSTYLGGNAEDVANAIAVDVAGNAYITGRTQSPDFPDADFNDFNGTSSPDVFVAKLASDGASLVYSRYVGGASHDTGRAIALDGSDGVVVTGYTRSSDFPVTADALDSSLAGVVYDDAFVLRLDAAGALTYASYLGGDGADRGEGIAVDAQGDLYVTGSTESSDLPVTAGGYQQAGAGTPVRDAFLAKQLADNSGYGYLTYLGGPYTDMAYAVAVDGSGRAHVVGSAGDGFPLVDPVRGIYGGGSSDAFLSRISAEGDSLEFSTYLGGGAEDVATGLALHPVDGSVLVGGYTLSANFPVLGPVQTENAGLTDTFLTKLDLAQSGTDVWRYSTYLGGGGDDQLQGLGVDVDGNVYVAGWTDSTDFPRVGDLQPDSLYDDRDGFVAKFGETTSGGTATASADLYLSASDSPDPVEVGATLTYTVTVENLGPDGASDVVVTATPPGGLSFTSVSAPGFICTGSPTVTCAGGSVAAGASTVLEVTVTPSATGTLAASGTVSAAEADPDDTNNNAAVSTSVVVADSGGSGDTGGTDGGDTTGDGDVTDGTDGDTTTASGGGGGGGAAEPFWLLVMGLFALLRVYWCRSRQDTLV